MTFSTHRLHQYRSGLRSLMFVTSDRICESPSRKRAEQLVSQIVVDGKPLPESLATDLIEQLCTGQKALIIAEPAPAVLQSFEAVTAVIDDPSQALGDLDFQLLDHRGRAYSDIDLEFSSSSGDTRSATTDQHGAISLSQLEIQAYTTTLPEGLRLPHPRQTQWVALVPPQTADQRLPENPCHSISVRPGQPKRVILGPPRQAVAFTACHFEATSAFPSETMLLLVDTVRGWVRQRPDVKIMVFGHVEDPERTNPTAKALSERRARFVTAVLQSNLDDLVAVVDEDQWTDEHAFGIANFLGVDAPTPEAELSEFSRKYTAGHYENRGTGRGKGTLVASGAVDSATRRALLDAYLAQLGASVDTANFADVPSAGCAGFNPGVDGAGHGHRVTLAAFLPETLPRFIPCTEGDEAACECEEQSGGKCRFFQERIAERTLAIRNTEDLDDESSPVLQTGARLLVVPAPRVAAAAYSVPASVVEGSVYTFEAPPQLATLPSPQTDTRPRFQRLHWEPEPTGVEDNPDLARQLPMDKPPDGTHLRPMHWSPGDPRTLEEIYLDFLAVALGHATGTRETTTADTLAALLPVVTAYLESGSESHPDDARLAPFSAISLADLTRHVLVCGLIAVGQTLNPKTSNRYVEIGMRYKCNVYASDFVNMLPHGAWLPKVIWAYPAKVLNDPEAADSARISAVGVSGISNFLWKKRGVGGERYGWIRLLPHEENRFDVHTKAQALANRGTLIVMSSASTDRDVGHVALVVPECKKRTPDFYDEDSWMDEPYKAELLKDGRVHRVLRSQAGSVNGHGIWGGTSILHPLRHTKNQGFFYYDPRRDQSRGHDVVRKDLVL